MKQGYIKLYRKFQEWEWYSNINTRLVFIHLLLIANYTDKKWQGIEVKRGQVIIGREKLAEQVGIKEQPARTALKNLQLTNEITIKKTKYSSLITIVNYEKYQGANQQSTSEITSNQPEPNQQSTTTKEGKQGNKEKKDIYTDDFLEFYNSYPKKVDKKKAFSAFKKCIKTTSLEKIMQGLENYKLDIIKNKTESQFIKHPTSWLNAGSWESEYDTPNKKPIKRKVDPPPDYSLIDPKLYGGGK